jgi:hypothetical protein
MSLSFFDPLPCDCCGQPRPRNRTWLAKTCTPSCWLALTPADRRRMVGQEGKPCLACQDRIGERRRMTPRGPAQPAPTDLSVQAEHRDWLSRLSTSATPARIVKSEAGSLFAGGRSA